MAHSVLPVPPRAARTRCSPQIVSLAARMAFVVFWSSDFAPGVATAGPVIVAPLRDPVGAAGAQGLRLESLGRVRLDAAEVVSLDPDRPRAYVTSDRSVAAIDYTDPRAPRLANVIDVLTALGFADEGAGEVTHVEADPAGRGFLAACVVIEDRGERPGVLAFLAADDLRLLAVVDAGFTPDSCAFTADGARLFVANEGEASERGDPPGTISWISLEGCSNPSDVALLDRAAAHTTFLCGLPLSLAVRERNAGGMVRIHPRAQAAALDLEPEYITIADGRVFVTLQENNAIAILDASDGRLLRIVALDAAVRRIDGDDSDHAVQIASVVRCLPMPDQIASFRVPGRSRRYLVTADEGDDRGTEGAEGVGLFADRARVSDLQRAGRLVAHPRDAGLARLLVSTIDGDEDGDGVIETPTHQGGRSLSVWDAETLARVGDTGSQLEEWSAREAPAFFNASIGPEGLRMDDRSDDRGPEPEGVCTALVKGVPYAFVSLERPGAIAVVCLADPRHPEVVHLEPLARVGALGPEGLRVVAAARSPTGTALLVVACEASSAVLLFEIVP